jgi:uncharacterized membrane protein HdeD (DUF308 family)
MAEGHDMSDSPLTANREPKGLRITLGVVCIVLGLIALIWPQATLLVVALVFGLQLIAAGLVRIVAAVTLKDLPGWWRAVAGILGALTVIAGIICFFRPGTSLLVLALVLAIGWIIDGISELVSAFAVPRPTGERIGLIAFGVLGLIAAAVVLIFPGESLVLLARIGGVVLLAFGVLALIAAFAGRGERRSGADAGPGTA